MPAMAGVVICDIDGTIADHSDQHRGHFEYDKVGDDSPIYPIIELVNLLAQRHDIVFLSGREDSCRDLTLEWLDRHVACCTQPHGGAVELYMRPTGDFRQDDEMKAILFERHIAPREVAYVLEDRDRNVKMWRAKGLTCLQVRDGNF